MEKLLLVLLLLPIFCLRLNNSNCVEKIMNNLICFSQYFVNKQNVRSFSNILNSNLLKSENDIVFLQNIFQEKEVVNDISPELKQIIMELRQNIKTYSKYDFKDFLLMEEISNKDLQQCNKLNVLTSCYNALNKIIPLKFYGNNHNNKILKNSTKLIIFSMKRQYFDFERLIKRWDLTIFPWSSVSSVLSFKILYNTLNWIFTTILPAIIYLNFYVTTCKLDSDENKLIFFWKNQWQRFYDKKISNMVTAKIINKFEPYCSGKNLKGRYNLQERLKLKVVKRDTPKLHLVLKPNNEYRPIVRYKNESMTSSEKYKIKERFNFLHTLTKRFYKKIEHQFSCLFIDWQKRNKPQLYFIKTDLSNAFGSINKEKLLKILNERYLEFQKAEKSLSIKKKFAQQYQEMLTELKKPLLIRAGSTIYEWKKGLVQGYKYSPALSELYYSYLDNIYFSNHMKNQKHELKLFIRVVDDYLYITDTLEDAYEFLNALSNYRNVNYSKTFVNFPHESIKFSQEITFLGYSYNTVNLQVSRANTIFTGDMCYKIGFTAAISDLDKFIENRIGQSGIQINGHIFNFYNNDENLIWNHLFVTLCFSANKFCTILAILCNEEQMLKYLALYKKRVTVKLCNSIVDTLKRNQPNDFIFRYCINHFSYLSFKALLLCAQRTPKCNVLVPYVNIELARTNCMYGKWREHASRISRSGKNQRQALREICKRTDLKLIMNNFNQLPNNFQCYNQKEFYK